jgi:hypothetical protein
MRNFGFLLKMCLDKTTSPNFYEECHLGLDTEGNTAIPLHTNAMKYTHWNTACSVEFNRRHLLNKCLVSAEKLLNKWLFSLSDIFSCRSSYIRELLMSGINISSERTTFRTFGYSFFFFLNDNICLPLSARFDFVLFSFVAWMLFLFRRLRRDIYTKFHKDWFSHSKFNKGVTYTDTDSKVIS